MLNALIINDIINFMESNKEFWYEQSDQFKKAYDSDFYINIKNNKDNEPISIQSLEKFIKNDICSTMQYVLSEKTMILYFIETNKDIFKDDIEFIALSHNDIYNKILNNEKVSNARIEKLYNAIKEFCRNKEYNEIKDPIIFLSTIHQYEYPIPILQYRINKNNIPEHINELLINVMNEKISFEKWIEEFNKYKIISSNRSYVKPVKLHKKRSRRYR